ncbi:MAG: hypothetical protein KDD64_12270 [Bdellovibrionales bacterium]|nr:hypothetical protein [Bdellovibrionales bacterium]
MYHYELNEAADCLRSAKNINAALKSFLRHEVQKGDPSARFVKGLKSAATAPRKESLVEFLEKALPKYEPHLFLILRYAFQEEVEGILDQVITTHAEEFNKTYSSDGNTIEVVDRQGFEKIASHALSQISDQVNKSDLPKSNLMKNAVAFSLFERPVLREVEPLMHGG